MFNQYDIQVIVLAGGKSKRMLTGNSKVLQEINGEAIIKRDLKLLDQLGFTENTVIVLSFDNEKIKQEIATTGYRPIFVDQGIPLGTAHAVKMGLSSSGNSETTLVLYGDDSSLFKPQTIIDFVKFHVDSGSAMTLLTVTQNDINYLGYIKRNSAGQIVGIDGPSDTVNLLEKETVCGAFCFSTTWLRSHITKIKKNDFNGEYPLPGLIPLAALERKYPKSFKLKNHFEWTSVNTPEELERARNYQNMLLHGKN